MTNTLHHGDLPDGLDLGPIVAVDSETMGLNPQRDRLCLIQLSAGDGVCHLVQFAPGGYQALFAKLAEHPLWNELSAVRNDRVIFIPDYTNPTPQSLVGARVMLDELVPRIYPDLFPDGPLTDEDVRRILEERAQP